MIECTPLQCKLLIQVILSVLEKKCVCSANIGLSCKISFNGKKQNMIANITRTQDFELINMSFYFLNFSRAIAK